MAYSLKRLRVTVTLGSGAFSGGGNTVTVDGLPTAARITKHGGEGFSQAKVTIKNMTLDTVTQLTSLFFLNLEVAWHRMQVEAGEAGGQLSTVFIGEVSKAVPKFELDGSLSITLTGMCGYQPGMMNSPPLSVQGNVDVTKLLGDFAKESGYEYKNNGVSGSVQNCVLKGSPVQKARALARQNKFDLIIDDEQFISQPFTAPVVGDVPYVSKETGLLGYPTFTDTGVACTTLFNPSYRVGGHFELKTLLPKASGVWQILKCQHDLAANDPNNGSWQSSVEGMRAIV